MLDGLTVTIPNNLWNLVVFVCSVIVMKWNWNLLSLYLRLHLKLTKKVTCSVTFAFYVWIDCSMKSSVFLKRAVDLPNLNIIENLWFRRSNFVLLLPMRRQFFFFICWQRETTFLKATFVLSGPQWLMDETIAFRFASVELDHWLSLDSGTSGRRKVDRSRLSPFYLEAHHVKHLDIQSAIASLWTWLI
jgi:hypothetical protein